MEHSTTTHTTTRKQVVKDSSFRVLAAVGAIVILIGIIFVGIRAVRLAMPNVSSALAGAFASLQSSFQDDERITLSVLDSFVVANEPFTLNWNHAKEDEVTGSYTFFYECNVDDVYLTLDGDTVFCNRPLDILGSDTSLALTAVGNLSGIGQTIIPVSVQFTENNSDRVATEGTVLLEVFNEKPEQTATTTASSTPESENEPTTPTPPVTPPTTPQQPVITDVETIGGGNAGPVSDPNGNQDLTVNVLAFGLTHKTTGAFTELDEIPHDLPSNMRGAIKFEVVNIGTKTVERGWRMEVDVPTSPSYTYKAPTQPQLLPGERIEYIIGFDKVRNRDTDTFAIEVDSEDTVDESNESNNRKSGTVQIDR